jgi:glycosyltransferase involved in cell wall biosynthesis
MKILHVSNDHFPTVMGGTEIFVERLSAAQQQLPGVSQVKWAAHQKSGQESRRDTTGSNSCEQIVLPEVISGGRLESFRASSKEIPGFLELLNEYEPDVVHLHSFSIHCGIEHARATTAFGSRLVVTVHTPSYSCSTGTLIDMNGNVCDGRLRPRRCTSCRLQKAGLSRPAAAVASLQRSRVFSTESDSRIARIASFRTLIEGFHESWLELASIADAIHVYARWLESVVGRHGIPLSKVHHVRTAGPPHLPSKSRSAMGDGVLRVVYWGRAEEVKGIHLVAEAILALDRALPISFDIYTNGWDQPYGRYLAGLAARDDRITPRRPVPASAMTGALQSYDLAVVPSTWLETGPLTVLEAFAAGLPVAGSPLGGVAEKLEGVPGTFLADMNPRAWAELLSALVDDPTPLEEFIRPPSRTFDDVARELLASAYRAD